MNAYLTVGVSALVGAALFEAALVPGLVIGGAAVLAPAVLPRLGRRPPCAARRTARRSASDPAGRYAPLAPIRAAHKLEIGQALAKTITFRIIVTAIDFSGNYIVLGDPTTAAGLTGISLVAGPTFYFLHETTWNGYGPAEGSIAVRVPFLRSAGDGGAEDETRVLTVSRAIAKTVTFRTIATVMDFAVTYLIVGDAATAALLTSFGFVLGPFVYWGHEKAWEMFAAPRVAALESSLLPRGEGPAMRGLPPPAGRGSFLP